jgi:hypothetical protein
MNESTREKERPISSSFDSIGSINPSISAANYYLHEFIIT